LALLDALAPVAAQLLGGPVLPTRAKGVRYRGSTPWHVDSERPVASVGFAAYLAPLSASTGALRVMAGSHRATTSAARASELTADHGEALLTEPGDVIAFDEHLLHASFGGTTRLQWRLDYLRDPVRADEVQAVGAYFDAIFPAASSTTTTTTPYDAGAFPSYGPDWLASGRTCVARLRDLGVYERARGR
jgi:hypothetical protein